jgi:hypothetical protein
MLFIYLLVMLGLFMAGEIDCDSVMLHYWLILIYVHLIIYLFTY